MRAGGVVPGNLYPEGSGDPTLTERDLAAMAAAYKAKGVTRIAGGVMADTAFFDTQAASSSTTRRGPPPGRRRG